MLMDLSMLATLRSRAGGYLSGTARTICGHGGARPGPRHGETGRDNLGSCSTAVLTWRLADDVAKGTTERAQAGEAHVQTDVGHAAVRFAEQEHGALDAATLQVAMRRLAERLFERADEVGLRDHGDA